MTNVDQNLAPKLAPKGRWCSIVGVVALGVLVVFAALAIFGEALAPYHPNDVNVGPRMDKA